MESFAFLLDENVPHVLRDQLWQHDANLLLLTLGEETAPRVSTSDPQILEWLEANDYLLITRNRRSMPQHLNDHLHLGGHIPGILLLRPQRSLSEISSELLMIVQASHPDEYRDRITYLPL